MTDTRSLDDLVDWSEFDGPIWRGHDPAAVAEALPLGRALDELLADLRATWRGEAACAGRTDVNWFPERGESYTEAIELCRRCPVREPCLEDAIAEQSKFDHGIRGGMSASARTKLRRRRRQHRQ